MQRQFVVTRRYTVLHETKKKRQNLNRPSRKHVLFLRKCEEKRFVCGHNILTEGVFVTKLSSNSGISI